MMSRGAVASRKRSGRRQKLAKMKGQRSAAAPAKAAAPNKPDMTIRLRGKQDLERMRAAGRVVRAVHDRMEEICKPGITTLELDEEAGRVMESFGGRGLFKNYPTYRPGEGFPANLCISINEEVVHGIASDRQVQDGDIVSLDCGVMLDGWCGDAANTVLVGNVAPEIRKLVDDAWHVLDLAIRNLRPGRKWSQIARLMQSYAESNGYGVVRDFVGHGIGEKMHEPPKVPNYVSRELLKDDITLRAGMVLAIEPMLNLGTKDTEMLDDGWTVVTKDRKASCHVEHTVAVTNDGGEILTDGR